MEHSDVLERIARLLSEAKSDAQKHNYRTLSYFIDMALVQVQDDIARPPETGTTKASWPAATAADAAG